MRPKRRFAGRGQHHDSAWTTDCEKREHYGAGSVEGQLLAALDAVRVAARVAGAGRGGLHAEGGRPHQFSRAARTDRGADALCNVVVLPVEGALLGDGGAEALQALARAVDQQLPRDVRLFQLFPTSPGFHAKQFCEFRQCEPCPALPRAHAHPGPRLAPRERATLGSREP